MHKIRISNKGAVSKQAFSADISSVGKGESVGDKG